MPGVPRHLARVAQRRLKLPHTLILPSCVKAHAARESRLHASQLPTHTDTLTSPTLHSGPEPPYARPNPASYKIYRYSKPISLTYGPTLLGFDITYETWGELSPAKDNVILLHTGLSASSHAVLTDLNSSEGWWEKFIICTNVLGGCYGSTGPSSVDPSTGKPVRAQFCLLIHLEIDKLYVSMGSSVGAMQSLAAGWLYPEHMGKVVSISETARSSPSAIAMRFAQHSEWVLLPPHTGMKLARQIAAVTYRSSAERDQRFSCKLKPLPELAITPDESFYDINSLIYISKAMDVFDLTRSTFPEIHLTPPVPCSPPPRLPHSMSSHPPSPSHSYYHWSLFHSKSHPPPSNPPRHLPDLAEGLHSLAAAEVADALRMTDNRMVSYYELGGVWDHDIFL
ncbi:uncharacterized protein LAESUDRAFT_803366 [Laetiporus sulphureus 93-53]|uniref:AB hydrolase-1 domain-containing protein n=1 Tax=Laetiporus sulphureus 93-53 TaxID=1314785 RepID=A0A165FEN7_9APHY|nr:uncharacterized protein LAESUDRAFT_803366 [Laetiporus sulphureus 93-53]KZT08855.1 hypothetical protein LAESUDRAFT_803366 [Laetiporus sulphureus 93-53]